jgi:RNA polymerase sigma factor (sigma-70 family)
MSGRISLRLAAAAEAAMPVNRSGVVSEADAALFQTTRPRLFGIAYRVLGSASEADDVVQETWIRWQGTDRGKVRDAAAFLATTTTRLAINVTQSARARRETHIGSRLVDPVDAAANPSLDAEQSEALESAVRLLLQKLSPAERAAYVLREAFDYPYRHISQVLALSEANARQLVTRARRRLCGEHRRPFGAAEQQRLLDAFVAAAQTGDLAALEQLLAADVAAYHGGGEVVAATRLPVRGASLVHVAA